MTSIRDRVGPRLYLPYLSSPACPSPPPPRSGCPPPPCAPPLATARLVLHRRWSGDYQRSVIRVCDESSPSQPQRACHRHRGEWHPRTSAAPLFHRPTTVSTASALLLGPSAARRPTAAQECNLADELPPQYLPGPPPRPIASTAELILSILPAKTARAARASPIGSTAAERAPTRLRL